MKKIFTLGILLLSFSVFAQEAGKAGELLRNEVTTNEMQTQRSNETLIRGEIDREQPNTRRGVQNNNRRPQSNRDFRWNYNYGNAEVFLRIPENGRFTVEIGDQMMSNSTGKFRFFELRAGSVPILIYENNYLVYRTRINVRNNTRTVLDFFSHYGLYHLGTFPQHNRSYGISEWDDIWNNNYINRNHNNRGANNHDRGGYVESMEMIPQEFNRLLRTLNEESFEKNKSSMISTAAQHNYFTAQQITELLGTLSFESNKLELAKELYGVCVDQRNYYLVSEALNFSSSKQKLNEYISSY